MDEDYEVNYGWRCTSCDVTSFITLTHRVDAEAGWKKHTTRPGKHRGGVVTVYHEAEHDDDWDDD
ncbi:hypothetical protein [Actinokineospora inagensis]|uniref:hypothetical protein n=1 Tax=Actinokineospora inagensis TaxID=103730 RepID=UPI00040F4242|nr:hypothetical protein [Actinokineospora inagensis]